jgi:hypothetical protein
MAANKSSGSLVWVKFGEGAVVNTVRIFRGRWGLDYSVF